MKILLLKNDDFIALAACKAACEAEPRCRFINMAPNACWLFATCQSPALKPGCAPAWWTTYDFKGHEGALWPPTMDGEFRATSG